MDNEKQHVENIIKKEFQKHFLVLFSLLVVTISIGFANFSSTLKISGNGDIEKMRWDVHFENITDTSKNAQVIVPATIKGNTTDIEYEIKLVIPGSYYKFETDIKNGGTIDAKLASLPTLTGISPEQSVYTNYTVTYSDGTPIKAGDVIKAGESRRITVTVEIEKDITSEQLPTTQQQLLLGIDLDYVQAD